MYLPECRKNTRSHRRDSDRRPGKGHDRCSAGIRWRLHNEQCTIVWPAAIAVAAAADAAANGDLPRRIAINSAIESSSMLAVE